MPSLVGSEMCIRDRPNRRKIKYWILDGKTNTCDISSRTTCRREEQSCSSCTYLQQQQQAAETTSNSNQQAEVRSILRSSARAAISATTTRRSPSSSWSSSSATKQNNEKMICQRLTQTDLASCRLRSSITTRPASQSQLRSSDQGKFCLLYTSPSPRD